MVAVHSRGGGRSRVSQRVWADVAKGQEEKSGQRKGGRKEKFPSRQEGS